MIFQKKEIVNNNFGYVAFSEKNQSERDPTIILGN